MVNIYQIFTRLCLPAVVSALLIGAANGQTGPGGVGNTTGSGGQPRNKLWLRADAGVFNDAGSTSASNSEQVYQWNDQSSNGSYAIQSTAANQPTYYTNALNGLPVIRFNGSSTEMLFGNRLDNSNALPMSFFAVTRNTTNPRGLFDSRPNNGDVFRFYSDGSANNSVEFWNQNPYKTGMTTSSAGSVVSVLGTLDGSSRRQLQAYIQGTQIGAIQTGTTSAVGFTSCRLGSINEGTAGWFNGDIAEVVLFSTGINAAQRVIVENYLGAKYGLTLTAGDYYANTSSTTDLIGIGTTDGTVKHSASNGGALLLTESSSTLNAAGEYIFAGHDGTSHSASAVSFLANSTVAAANVTSRWAREYRIEKTGSSDVTIGFDYTQAGLTRVSSTASDYVLLYRSSTGATNYSIVTISGSPDVSVSGRVSFTVTNANLSNGYYTLGLKSAVAATTLYSYNANCSGGCNYETATSWTTDPTGGSLTGSMVPRNIDNVVILNGNTVVVNSPLSSNNITINTGSTLDLSTSADLTCIGTLNGTGTLKLSANSGTLSFPNITSNTFIGNAGNTVEYSSNNSYTLPALPATYKKLTISGGGTKTASSPITVDETFTVQPPTTYATTSNLTLNGQFINNGQYNQTAGTTTFGSASPQTIGGSPVTTVFNHVTISNANGSVTSNIDFSISGNFSSSSNNASAFTASSTSAIIVSSNSAQSIGGTGSGTIAFYTLTTSGPGTKTINRSFTVSNHLNIISGSNLQFPSGGTGHTLSLKDLTVGGTFNMAAPGSATTHSISIGGNISLGNSSVLNLVNSTNTGNLTFTKTGAQSISGGTPTTVDLNNIIIHSTSQTTLSNFNLNVRGNLTIGGTLDLGSRTANRASSGGTLSIASTGTLKIGGTNAFPSNYSTNTLNSGSTVEYNGGIQNISTITYSNLTLSGGANKTLLAATTVNSALTLNGAILVLGANNLILPVGSSIAGTGSSSNFIQASSSGEVRRYFDGAGSITVPFGTGAVYSPYTLNITSATFGGLSGSRFIGIRCLGSVAPSVLDPTYAISKYWATTATNISNVNGSVLATYDASEANPVAEPIYGNAFYNGSAWTTGATSTVAARVITFTLTGSAMAGSWTAGPTVSFARGIFYSLANGNFETPGTWSLTGYAGAPSTIPPGPGSQIQIGNGRTVTVTAGSKNLSWVIVNPGSTLDLGTATGIAFDSLKGSGTIKITATGGTAVFPTVAAAKNIFVTTAGSTVEYYGGANYNLPASPATYRRLAITGSGSTKLILAATTVTESLVLNSGFLSLGNLNLDLGASALVTGAPSANAMVLTNGTGSLRKYFDGLDSFTWPVGTTGVYTPAAITLSSGTVFGGSTGSRFISLRAVSGVAPNQLDATYSLAKYWVTSSTDLTTVTASLSFTYDLSERNANAEPMYTNAYWNGASWATSGTVTSPTVTYTRTLAGNLNGNWTAGPSVAYTAGNFYSIADGNFESPSTWSLTSFGGAATLIAPTNYSTIHIGNNRTVAITAGSKTLTNSTLNVGNGSVGTLDFGSYSGISIGTLAGTGTIRITAAEGGTAVFPSVTSNNFVNTSGSTVQYYGSTNYSLPANPASYQILSIAGTGQAKSASGLITINQTLNLNGGLLSIGTNNLDLGASTTVTGTLSSTNMILTNSTGLVRKYFNGNGSFTFPFGTTGVYTPAFIDFTATTFTAPAGSRFIAMRPVATVAPNQLDASYSLTKHWEVSSFNISGTINASFTFTYSTSERNASAEPIYVGASYNAGWTTTGTVTIPSSQVAFSGITSLTRTFTAGPSVAFNRGQFYSIADGNFESGSSWSLSGYAGAATVIAPTLGSQINIGNGKTINVTAGSKNLSWLIVNSGSTLNLSTYTGITLDSLKGAGTIKISASGANAVFPTIATSTKNTFITTAGSTVEYNGLASFNLPSSVTSYQNLAITGAGFTKYLQATTTVNGSLILNSGLISIGTYNLDLAVTASVSGTPSASAMILANNTGLVRKYFDANGTFTFPFGTSGVYTPATINFTATTFNGATGSRFIAMRPVAAVAPNQLDASYSLTKYWSVSSFNIAGTINASFSFTYDVTERNAIAEAIYVGSTYNGSWVNSGTVTIPSQLISFSGITSLTRTFTAGPAGAFLPGSYYSRATGAYETGSTWSTTSYLGSASVIPPTNGSDVYVGNGFTVTASSGTKTIKLLQIDAASTLDIQTTTGYTITTFNGSGILKMASGTFPTVTTNNFITTAGNTVEYSGSGNYSLPSSITTYRNLTFSGTGLKTLSANTTINTTLTLNAGILDIAGYNLILPVGSSLAGNTPSASNMIRTSGAGVVRRYFDATNSSFQYPVGTGSVYTPFNLTFTGATLGGGVGTRYVDVKAVNTSAPSQLDATYSITKHWVVSATNFSNVTGSITATYDASEANATSGVEAIYGSAKYVSSAWTTGATSTVASKVITFPLSGATITGNYTAGPNVGFLPGTFFSFATGNYETAGTWSLTSFSGPVSPIPPTTGSSVQIGNNRVVTATSGSKTVPTVTIDGAPNPGTLDLQNFTGFTFTTLTGSGTLKLASGTFPTVTTNSFITTAGNTVEYSGSGNYNLPSSIVTYRNLTMSGTGTKTLLANTTVNTTLTLNSGILDIAGYNLILPVGSSLAGNTPSASNMIRTSGAGVVRRYFDVTNSSFQYPVGTSSVFTPFHLTFTNATLGGVAGSRYVDVKAVNTLAPSQLDATYSITKHWVVSATNFSNVTGSIAATYDASEANPTSGVEAIYGSAKYVSSTWSTGATSTVAARVITFPLVGNSITGNYTAGPNVGFLPGTFFSFATGNYETAGTWSLTGFGGPVSPIPPTTGSSVRIGNNRVVTTTSGSKTVPTVTIDGAPNPGTLDLQSYTGFTFTILTGSGTLKLSSGTFPTVTTNDLVTTAGSTVEYYGSTTYTLPGSPLSYRNLTINGSGFTRSLAGNTTVNENLVINSGTLELGSNNLTVTGASTISDAIRDNADGGTNTFTGNLTIHSTGSISTSNNSPFRFGGNITNNGTLSKTGSGSVTFNGGTQTIDGSNPITLAGSIATGTGTVVQNSNNGFVLSNISIGQNSRLRQQYSSFPTSFTGSNDGAMIQTGFEELSTSNDAGNTITSTSGDDITFSKASSGSVYGSRTISLAPSSTAQIIQFNIATSSTSATTNAATMIIGSGFSNNSTVHTSTARLQVNLRSTTGEFTLTHPDGVSTNSSTLSGTQTITWVINNSGSAFTYTNPNGIGSNSLADGKADVWAGNTRFAAGLNVQTPAQAMNNLKFVFNSGSGSITVTDIRVNPVGIINTSAVAQTCYQVTPYDGDSILVSFTPGSVSASTHFNSGNTYTAQLSNSAGSFSSPTTLGTLTTSALSGTIEGFIPANLASGNGYRVRVVSSNPVVRANDNGTNFTINQFRIAPAASQVLTTSGTGTLLTASGLNVTSYQWGYYTILGGPITDLTGKTSSTYTPNGPDFPGAGTYSLVCRMVTSGGCGTNYSNYVAIFINCPVTANLVVNGDFSAGNTGFTSQYNYVTDSVGIQNEMWPEQTYAVVNNPNDVHSMFCNMNTPALRSPGSGGNMLVGNAATSGSLKLWTQNIPVTANTDYVLTFNAVSLAGAESSLLFGIYTGCYRTGADVSVPFETVNCVWNKYSFQFNSGNNTSIPLSIVNISAQASGNDIAIDDINVYACASVSTPPFSVANAPYWRGISNDWFNKDNWGTTCSLPTCSDDVYIPLLGTGKVYPVINASGAAAKNVQIRTGARLTINSGYNINVCGNLENQGIMTNHGTSSITLSGNINPVSLIGTTTGSSKLTNVIVNKTNATDTVKMTGNVEISGNFTITRGTFKAKGYNMIVGGNISNAGTYIHGNGSVEINGTGNSVVTKTGTGNYYNLKINKTTASRTVTFSTATTTVENQLDLTRGIAVTAGANEISVTNSATSSVVNHSSSGYVNGRLRRSISGANSYDFPLGDASRYELVNMNATSALTGTSNILGFFTGSTPTGADPNLMENGKLYEFVCQNGYWTLTPNAQPTAGAYNLTINPVGFDCQAPYQTIAKRTNSGTAWTFGGSTPVSGTQRNGFTSFSEFAQIDAEEPLPLNLLSFLGQWRSQKIRLEWKTANERDHSHFIIERSADGSAFEPIGKINSDISSPVGTEYQFIDEHPGERNQYRLKQVDNDGSYVYSHMVTLSKNGPDVFAQASPNPVTQSDILYLNLTAGNMEEYQMNITDVTGKTVFSQTITTESGENRFEIPFRKNFPKGVYTIRLIGLNENAADHHPIKLMVE